jgi:hypothetical protein
LAAILFWVVLASWAPEYWWFGLAEVGVLGLGLVSEVRLTVRPFALQLGLVFILLAGHLPPGKAELVNS